MPAAGNRLIGTYSRDNCEHSGGAIMCSFQPIMSGNVPILVVVNVGVFLSRTADIPPFIWSLLLLTFCEASSPILWQCVRATCSHMVARPVCLYVYRFLRRVVTLLRNLKGIRRWRRCFSSVFLPAWWRHILVNIPDGPLCCMLKIWCRLEGRVKRPLFIFLTSLIRFRSRQQD